jgi:protease I
MKGWAVVLVLILVLMTILLSNCTTNQVLSQDKEEPVVLGEVPEQAQRVGGENMPKVLFIIAQANFRDEELAKPKAILENAGYDVEVASITTSTAIGMLGARVKPDLAIKDAIINDYVLIVVVGGSGAPELANHPEVLNLLSQAKNNDKKIAAICLGPMALAKAGVLQGKQATVFKTSDSIAALKNGGAIFVDQSVVVDAGLVTANGPGAAAEFGNELVKLLKS